MEESNEHYEQTIQPPKVNAAGHGWRQHGPMLICTSCPFEHTFVPTDHNGNRLLLTHTFHGMDAQGQPILHRIAVKEPPIEK